MKRTIKLVCLLSVMTVGSMSLIGCSSAPSASVYESSEALKPQRVVFATVLAVRNVTIDTSTDSKVGTIAGGAIGGIAGSRFGSGRGTDALLGGVIGATVGAVAGSAAENMASKSEGLDITVRTETGETLSIVQAADVAISVGQQVRLLTQNGKYRVAP